MRQQCPTLLEEAPVSEASRHWEGQVVDGKFLLGEYLGGSDRSAVFLTDYPDAESQKAAIKLIPEIPEGAESQLSQWQLAASLTHPQLLRIFQMGRCRVGSANLLYVVMEHAEENLAQILPQRPLTAGEARDMLKPVLDALSYLHENGFLHGHVKPSNIMACADQLKLAMDGLRPMAHSIDHSQAGMGAYDPPGREGSPAADVWSLGMTIVEVLTQRLPIWERVNNTDPVVPATLPPPFLDIARGCLRRDPLTRWKLLDIASRLQPDAARPQVQQESVRSTAPPKGRYAAIAAGLALVLAVILAWPHSRQAPSKTVQVLPPAAETASTPIQSGPSHIGQKQVGQVRPAQAQKAPIQAAPTRVSSGPKPPAPKFTESRAVRQPAAVIQPSAPVVKAKQAPSVRAAAENDVVHQVLPDVPQKARDTIHGKVRVAVKVTVDPSGSVSAATLDDSGPSRYFANLALQAAQQWKFSPARIDTRDAPTEWILRFVFSAEGTQAYPTRKAR